MLTTIQISLPQTPLGASNLAYAEQSAQQTAAVQAEERVAAAQKQAQDAAQKAAETRLPGGDSRAARDSQGALEIGIMSRNQMIIFGEDTSSTAVPLARGMT